MSIKSLMCAAAASMLLAACGGGGEAVGPVGAGEVPASATASPVAFSRYVGSLPANDRAEPLTVDKADPPTSETAEPIDAI